LAKQVADENVSEEPETLKELIHLRHSNLGAFRP